MIVRHGLLKAAQRTFRLSAGLAHGCTEEGGGIRSREPLNGIFRLIGPLQRSLRMPCLILNQGGLPGRLRALDTAGAFCRSSLRLPCTGLCSSVASCLSGLRSSVRTGLTGLF